MNNIERLTKLSGIYTLTEAFGEKKYADHDKSSLHAVKKELQGIMATAARASFKYKNAAEELKVVEECLKKLDEPEKKEVKESEEVVASVVESKDDDKKDDDKEEKSEKKDKDSDDKKDDEKDSDKKDSDKKEDDKPDFLKDKKKDSDDKDSDKEDKKEKEEKADKDSDKKEDKKEKDSDKKEDSDEDDKEDKDDDDKTVKVEVKVEESEVSVEEIVARILEKDLTPTKVEVDFENGPTENSGVKFEQGTKIRVPSAVKAEVKQRIAELNQAILRYDDKGYDDKSIKQQAVDCLNQILQNLSTNDLEGVKKAQIYLETLMSPLTDFFPPKLINWLANAVNPYVGDAESA